MGAFPSGVKGVAKKEVLLRNTQANVPHSFNSLRNVVIEPYSKDNSNKTTKFGTNIIYQLINKKQSTNGKLVVWAGGLGF